MTKRPLTRLVPPLLALAAPPLAAQAAGDVDADAPAQGLSVEELARRVAELERELDALHDAPDEGLSVDLSAGQVDSLGEESTHVLARPWYRNIDISGFGAVGYLDSGNAGTRPNGGFLVKESTLFVEAEAWENTSFFFELQVNRLGKDDSLMVRTGEVYARFDRIGGHPFGLKVGRVDIPFGEEYLWQDAPDNPLITTSAPYPYGFDEGVVAYGDISSSLSWVASVTDGTDGRSIEDDPAKAVTAKLGWDVSDALYVSASAMTNGKASKSAFEFGGSHFEPVGAGGAPSTAGASASPTVDAHLWQLDAVAEPVEGLAIAGTYGRGTADDDDSTFDRDLDWFMIQPTYELSSEVFVAFRYSGIGTDGDQGYHFDGKILAGGNSAFGYDATDFTRLSAGVGWRPNPRTLLKLEVGKDDFDLVGGSPFDPMNSDRTFFGLELVLTF